MTDYRIRIIVEGDDRASGPLGRINSALGGMGSVAGGIIGAQALMGIARGIIGIGTSAVAATAQLQTMEIGMASLAAREIANEENARRLADAVAQGLDETQVGLMKISDALPQAEVKAAAMMEELSKLAVVSPYQLDVVQGSYQMAQAFGYSGDEAMKFTKALLNVGAGVGANNERLNRMAYNLAQIRMVGKVTAVDFRQLAMAGFDLGAVLQYVGRETGNNIQTYEDFNKALDSGAVSWEQFSDIFLKYAEENFGGAAERMSRSLQGLSSTFKDLMILTFPKILGPAAETFTGFANKVLDAFLLIRESGILEKVALGIDSWMKNVTASLLPFVDKITNLIEAVADAGVNSSEFREALGYLIGEENLEKISAFIGSLQKAVDAIRPFIEQVVNFIANNVKISDVLSAIGLVLISAVIPALLSAAAAFAPFLLLVGGIALIRTAWQNNWLGMRDTLTEAWTTSILPALQQLWAWLQVNVPLAIQTLSNYWQTVLLPALQSAWSWIQTNLLPLLSQLWAWLQINIPLAIQALSNYWSTVLLPAIQAVGTWITTVFIPALSGLWAWLSTNIPAAIDTLSGYWQNTLLPAIMKVWSWLDGTLFPFITALNDFIGAVFGLTVQVFAGLWENILLPALKAVGDFLSAILSPAFDTLKGGVEKLDGPLKTLERFLAGALKKAFEGISKAIQGVTDWLKKMADKIAAIKLPGWLTPGSPTPFEIGLRGISRALADVNRALDPGFSFSMASASNSGGDITPVVGGGGGGDVFVEQHFYDAGAAAIGMAQVATMKRQRLSSSFGG